MGYIVLGIIALVCAIGWLSRYISCAIMVWYIQENGWPMPTDKDLAKGKDFVVSHILKDLKGSGNKH